jgi:collagen type III alpha
VNTEGGS